MRALYGIVAASEIERKTNNIETSLLISVEVSAVYVILNDDEHRVGLK